MTATRTADPDLTGAEAAAMLRISTRTLDRRRKAGQIGFVTRRYGAGYRVFYKRSVLVAYLHRVDETVDATMRQDEAS